MSDEKIAEIRARHNYTEEMWWAADDPCANQAHADRAALLAEVERLREVLKIVRINGPDAQGLVWLSFCREGGVRVCFVVGHKERMVSQALLEFEQIRRKALEAKP
jgi:hypothetical protein